MTKNFQSSTEQVDVQNSLTVKISHSFQTALHFLLQLRAQGVRDIVLCAGSRSAPLAYAALLAEQQGDLRLHTFNDERAAGFYALGLVRAGEPDYLMQSKAGKVNELLSAVAVITTSGSAPGHLLPAILEAEAAGLPLIVISADRPHYLRGVKASQTTRQMGMFAQAVRDNWELPAVINGVSETDFAQHLAYVRQIAVRATSGAQGIFTNNPGPVQVNMAFADPLTPIRQINTDLVEAEALLTQHYRQVHSTIKTVVLSNYAPVNEMLEFSESVAHLSDPNLTLVLAGDRAGMQCPDLLKLCSKYAWPIWAQPGAILNIGASEVDKSLLIYLPNERMLTEAERVIVVGAPTLSRTQMNILRAAKTVWVVDNSGTWADACGVVQRVYTANNFYKYCMQYEAITQKQKVWCQAVMEADKLAEQQRVQQILDKKLLFAQSLTISKNENIASDMDTSLTNEYATTLSKVKLLDESSDLELPLPFGVLQIICKLSANRHTPLVLAASSVVRDAQIYAHGAHIFTNRGLAGIDGTLAFAKGISHGLAQRVMVALGDQAFIHDFSALFNVNAGEAELDVFVFDDNGGGIFAGLEHGKAVNKTEYNRIFGLGGQLNISGIAQAIGAQYSQVNSQMQIADSIYRPATSSVRIWHITYDLFMASCLRRHIQI